MDQCFEIKINTLDEKGLLSHLVHCNTPLSMVNLEEHVHKLRRYATTVEIWNSAGLAGLCACYLNRSETGIAYITHIEVHPEYKRMGYGRRLINETIVVARSKSFTKIQLEVKKDNAAALAFYNSLGFAIQEDRPLKYLMSKDI